MAAGPKTAKAAVAVEVPEVPARLTVLNVTSCAPMASAELTAYPKWCTRPLATEISLSDPLPVPETVPVTARTASLVVTSNLTTLPTAALAEPTSAMVSVGTLLSMWMVSGGEVAVVPLPAVTVAVSVASPAVFETSLVMTSK